MKKITAGDLLDGFCALTAGLAMFPVIIYIGYETSNVLVLFIKFDIVLPDFYLYAATIGVVCLTIVIYMIFLIAMQALSNGIKDFYHRNFKKKTGS
jgi:hypothetical protein